MTSEPPDRVHWSTLQKLGAAAVALVGMAIPAVTFYVRAESFVTREEQAKTLAPIILDVRSSMSRLTDAERGLRIVQLREAVRKCARKNAKPSLRYDAEVAATADFDDQLSTTNMEVDAYRHACGIHVQ